MNNDITPVVNYSKPEELEALINFKIDEAPVNERTFLNLIDRYLEFSVNTGNKQFFNQLYSGFNFPAFLGEIFTVLTNTSVATYEAAPVATLIEKEMIDLLNSYAGFNNGDGVFLTGGSNANLIAMFSARNKRFPEISNYGYTGKEKLTAFINEEAHYSIENAANLLGIGAKGIIKVKADKKGKLIPEELEKAIKESKDRGETPFFAVATCGTTLRGAYDPIEPMYEICKKHNLWLHVDGALGASILLSKKYRYLMSGIEKADSLTWDAHKTMNIPLVASVILTKEKGVLANNITDINADYMFHNMEQVDDLGKKSIQCGRRPEAVKLWFAWKYFGKDGYEKRIDNLIELGKYAESIVKEDESMELLSINESFTVCFRYLPNETIDIDDFNFKLRHELRNEGKTFVNYGHIDGKTIIRLVITNGETEKSDIDKFFNLIKEQAVIIEKRVLKYA